MWWLILLGLVVSLAIGIAGYLKGALDRSGVLGAVLVGTLTFGLGGWEWGVLLVAFFVSSSFLSRYREADKATLAEKFAKGSRRDLGQALANGGVGALLAVGSALLARAGESRLLWLTAYVGAMATVNADTWATELGVLSRQKPRLITNGQPVEIGTSGGVTWLGVGAAVAGGGLIGLLAGLFYLLTAGEADLRPVSPAAGVVLLALCGLLAGLIGSLVDSLLGATVQVIYRCDRCDKETERAVHRCGTVTRRLRGWQWLNNDLVNLSSSVVGAAVAAGLMAWLV